MKILIITDTDLDGAGSAIFLKALHNRDRVYIDEVVQDKYFSSVISKYDIDKYDKVYITDLHIPDDMISKIDKSNVVIVDHHLSHFDVRDRYQNAKVILQPFTSTVSLLSTTLKTDHLSENQKKLMTYIDDYDQYSLKYRESLQLQAIMSSYNNPRAAKFVSEFENGFREFTSFEKNAISIYAKKFKKAKETTDFFTGKVGNYKWVSFVCDQSPNELASYALAKYSADVCLILYPSYGTVSFRKSKGCDAKLNKIAETLCDGGGHEYAAGGKLNDNIINLTKKLTLC